MIQGGEEEEKGGEGGVGPLGVGEGLSSLQVWLTCRHIDVSTRWCVGALVLWCAGTLLCWHVSVGLAQWHTGKWVHCHAGVWTRTSGEGSARVYTL